MWRFVGTTFIILLVAMVANLLVAWLIAWRFDSERIVARASSDVTQVNANGSWWQATLENELLTLRMQVAYDAKWTGGPDSTGTMYEFASNLPSQVRGEMLDWCGSLEEPRPQGRCMIIVGRGWPLRSFYLRRDYQQSSKQFSVTGGWVIRPASSRVPGGIELPLRPLWPGVAINMAFYVPLVALLFAQVQVFRQWSRYRQGRCPKCAWDLRGNLAAGCEKCQWKRERRP